MFGLQSLVDPVGAAVRLAAAEAGVAVADDVSIRSTLLSGFVGFAEVLGNSRLL